MVFSLFNEATQALREVVAQAVDGYSISFPSHYSSSLPVIGVLGLFYRLLYAPFFSSLWPFWPCQDRVLSCLELPMHRGSSEHGFSILKEYISFHQRFLEAWK